MSTRNLKIGIIQQSCNENYRDNLSHSLDAIQQVAKQGAQLVLLQELHTGLYFCQREDVNLCQLAEPIPGPTTTKLSELAKQLNIVIVSSIFEKRGAGLFHNTAVVIEKNGEIAGRYRKMHIPHDPGFYEKFYFAPGDLGFKPISTSIGKLGVLVCWDQWFPEAARLMTLAGADLLLYPTAIGWGTQEPAQERALQRDAWITIQRAHAIANGLPVIVANRVGFESRSVTDSTAGILFWGSSFVAGPQGEILAMANEKNSENLLVSVNLNSTEKVRCNWPFLRDRRIDAYHDLLTRYKDEF